MKFLKKMLAALMLVSLMAGTANAAANTSIAKYDMLSAGSIVTYDVFNATNGTLSGKVTWRGSPSDGSVLLEIVQMGVAGCSIGGYAKPLWCYVGAPAFERGGFAPAGWYHVYISTTMDLSKVSISMTGDITEVANLVVN